MTKALNIRGEYGDESRTYAAKTWPLGTRMHLPDGQVYRYSRADSTALAAARVMRVFRPENNVTDLALVLPRTGPRKLTLTLFSPSNILARDVYEDGLLFLNDGTGEGYSYHVVSNDAVIREGTITVYLDSDWVVLPDSSTRVTLLRNRYNGLAQAESPPRAAVAGVSPGVVTANSYFWLQTSGAAVALQQDDLEAYLPVQASQVTSGAVELATTLIPTNTLSEQYSVDGIVVEPVLGDEGGPRRGRISRRSGIGVVPSIEIGYVLSPREHGQHCLVQLTLE